MMAYPENVFIWKGECIMKRVVVLLLCAVMIIGVFAGCGKEETQNETPKGFSVGFGRADVTPTESVNMPGYSSAGEPERMSTSVLNPLRVTCVAITDEAGQTMLVYTCDAMQIKDAFANELRKNISDATGVPTANIVLSATHCHSTPAVDGTNILFYDGVVKAAKEALADRAPATMEYGATTLENMTFVRHYTTHTGIVVGDNFNPAGAGVRTGHTTEADKELRLVRYNREGKKPVVMLNWLGHASMASTATTDYGKQFRYALSSDYIGFCVDYMESNSDCLVALYIGASGNINPTTRMTGEAQLSAAEYGEELGKQAITALSSMTAGTTGTVKTTAAAFERQGGSIEISTMGAGSLGVVVAPFEMFDTTSVAIREKSPYDTTFVLALANGYNSYMPTEICYDYVDCYEVRITQFFRGSAEKVADEYVKMLTEIHG